MSTDLSDVHACDITDISGALYILEQRSGQKFGPDTLYYKIVCGHLPAYIFVNGDLEQWTQEDQLREQTLIFLKEHIYDLHLF
jgi:hypothetical protein